MFQQRQELHPKLANLKRHLVRVRSEDGRTLHLHVCRAWDMELIIFGLARRKYFTVAGIKTANVETQFVLRLTRDHSDSLRSHKPRTRLGYNKHPCILPTFLPASELNTEVYKMLHFSNGIYIFKETKIKHKSSHFNDVFLPATDCSWCKPSYIFISPDRISLELAGMCRQETTVRFWGWKAVKDKNRATEPRLVSAGQHTSSSVASTKFGGVGCIWGGGTQQIEDANSCLVMQDLPALLLMRPTVDIYPSTS